MGVCVHMCTYVIGLVFYPRDGDDSAKTLNYIFYTLDDSSHNAYSHTFHRVDAQFKTSTSEWAFHWAPKREMRCKGPFFILE